MKWKHVLLIAGMFGVYLFLASRSIHEPLLGDSYASVFSAENMYAGKPFTAFHPLLYYASLNVVMHGGGGSPESYRIVGILGFLATLLLLIYLTRSVTGDTTAGLMAGALYAIHPMAVKGSLITDIDTTILPPLLLLFIIVFRKLESRMNIRSCLFLAFLLTIALWAKESTPLLLAAALVMYYFLQRKYGEGIVVGGTVAVAASLLFLVSWVSVPRLVEAEYSLVAPVANITGALKGSNIVTGKDASIAGSMRTLARLTLWLTPGFVGLLLMAFFDQAKAFLRGRKDTFTMYLAVYAALVLVAYLYIGRIAFGFPKYHYPLVSVGCVLLAITFAPFIKTLQKREILVSLAVGAFAALIYVFCVGDILYATDYAVREALAMNRFGWDRLCTVALQAGGVLPDHPCCLSCAEMYPRAAQYPLAADRHPGSQYAVGRRRVRYPSIPGRLCHRVLLRRAAGEGLF